VKKGKAKPYTKKEAGNRNKMMAYAIIAILVLSGIYFGLGISETKENKEAGDSSLKISQYNVAQIGDDILVGVVEELPEIIILLGEKARLDENTVKEVMNLSADTLYSIDGEASNSYVFFRFYATDISKALRNLTPRLDGLVGDYKIYRGYIGMPPGENQVMNRVYLIGPLNMSRGTVVKILLLEKTAGEKKLGYIGFIKSAITIGPIVDAEVNSIEGFIASGIALTAPNLDELNKSVPWMQDVNYNPTVFTLSQEVNETTLALEGVELQPGVNTTVLMPVNTSLESVIQRLGELKLNYTLKEGLLSLLLPVDASKGQTEEALSKLGVTNITWQKHGSIQLPKEVLVESMVVPIENNKNFSALLFMNATAKQKVKMGLVVIKIGDQALINARQV